MQQCQIQFVQFVKTLKQNQRSNAGKTCIYRFYFKHFHWKWKSLIYGFTRTWFYFSRKTRHYSPTVISQITALPWTIREHLLFTRKTATQENWCEPPHTYSVVPTMNYLFFPAFLCCTILFSLLRDYKILNLWFPYQQEGVICGKWVDHQMRYLLG